MSISNRIELIAETAWHHEGDYGFMQELISRICEESNADIVKMHITLDLDSYMDSSHSLYDTVKDWLFSEEQWMSLIDLINKSEKKLMLLLNDLHAIRFADTFSPAIVELHSVCMNVPELMEGVNNMKSNPQIVVGVGGASLDEIDQAVNYYDVAPVLMFGFQNYPTELANINLSKILKVQSLYPGLFYGYADHTGYDHEYNSLITAAVASNNMSYVEKHVTHVYGEKRCDYSAGISIEQFNELRKDLDIIGSIYGDGSLSLNPGEYEYSELGYMKMIPVLSKDVSKGDVLVEKCYTFKRSGVVGDISQVEIKYLQGKKFTKSMCSGDAIHKGDLE